MVMTLKRTLVVCFEMLLACLAVTGCTGRAGGTAQESAARSRAADSIGAQSADLCGTWNAVDLSVTTPNPGAQGAQPGGQDGSLKDGHTFCRPISVHIPASIDAVGDPGKNVATLELSALGDGSSGSSPVATCRYRGNGPNAATPSYELVNCERHLSAGTLVVAQSFSLEVDFKNESPSSVARVVLSDGSTPPADAYREYLGTTQNLAGVVLHVPGTTPFSGIGVADGPRFQQHAFVANEPLGIFVVGPSVQVLGSGSLPSGVRLTVPFDSAWISTLPAGTAATLQLLQISQTHGPLEAIDAAPVTDSPVVDSTANTLTVGLTVTSQYLTTIRDLTPISNHGGPLMNNGLNVYLIWAGDFDSMAATDDPRPQVRQFLTDLPGSPWYDILSTYGITNRAVTLAGEVSEKGTTSVTNVYSDAVSPALATNGGSLPKDGDGIYVVIAASNVTLSSDFCSVWCGFHTAETFSSGPSVKFALIGSPLSCPNGCSFNGTVNGGTVDEVISVVAHEIVETVTDPEGTGWHGANEISSSYAANVENADKCAWRFHSVQSTGAPNPLSYNITANGHQYFIQSNWVNSEGGYCGMGMEGVSIAVTPPSGGLAVNDIGHFSVTVTNTGPVSLDGGEFFVLGQVLGPTSGSSVPVPLPAGIPAGGSETIDVPTQAPDQINGNDESVTFQFQVEDPSNFHTFGAIAQTNVDVRRAAVLVDQAKCLGITLPPSVPVNTWFPVSVTFQNTGTTVWMANNYRVVGLPLNVVTTYLQTPYTLPFNVDPPSQFFTLQFSAYAPAGTYGQQYLVDVSMANAAATFASDCSGTTTVQCVAGAGSPCGSCNGVVQCDGSCSVATPSNFGKSCGACGGTYTCSGTCSIATPDAQVLASGSGDACCGTPGGQDMIIFSGACPNGEQRGTCAVTSFQSSDFTGSDCGASWVNSDPFDCTCKMHWASDLGVSVHCNAEVTQQPCN